tara:strand:- start:1357 stop:2208 length:852 start_codon:yes stop_codon:yes gene_type:complete
MQPVVVESHIIESLEESVRISDYGGSHLIMTPSRNSFKKAIRAKRVLLNGELADSSRMVKKGDVIEILPSEEVYPEHKIKIEVIFEDEYMAIVNKPAGLLTSGNQHRTLANAISTNLNESKEKARLPRPNPVHRLDRSASGLLIIAKTMLAQQDLSEQLANYTVDKTYRVISHGLAEKTGTVDLPIKEKSAQTQYKLIKTIPSNKYGGFSIMDVKIKQGRKNQIRVHLHSIGHTVVGDLLYPRENPGKGLYLHCYALTLNHPESGEKMTFEMDLPKKFEDFLN